MSTTQFIPLEPLATSLGLPRAWVKREADAGRIPFLRVGPTRRLFDVAAVRDALAKRAAEFPSAEPGTGEVSSE